MSIKNEKKSQLAKQALAIYRKNQKKLERQKRGKIAAIDVKSAEIFIGDSTIQAGLKAKKKHPDHLFYFKRIGYPAVHSLKGFIPSSK